MNRKQNALSIIVNYGCRHNCEYCIWKAHRLFKVISTCESFDFNNLTRILQYGDFTNLVSISGGGDPFNFSGKTMPNYKLLKKIFSIILNANKEISIHTRERKKGNILDNVRQIVLSYENLQELGLIEYLKYLQSREINIRIAKVAIDAKYDYKRDIIFAKEAGYQITFYASNKSKSDWFQELESNLSEIYQGTKFISEGNNKIYLMPDNMLYQDYAAKNLYKTGRECKIQNT